jgi:hypothetical protein
MSSEPDSTSAAGFTRAWPRPRSLYWAAAAGAALNALRSLRANPADGTLFTDPYWVGFYLSSYQDGFRRRALVGTLCRHLFPAGVPILAINASAFLILGAVFFLLLRSLCRLATQTETQPPTHPSEPRSALWLFALSASILTAVFYETLGDLLQVTLVLFSAAMLLAQRCGLRHRLRLLIGMAAIAVCFFIHEASIFLLAPALPFFLKRRPRWRDFLLPASALAALLALSVYWSATNPHPTNYALLLHHRVLAATIYTTPSLRDELRTEYRIYFSSSSAIVYFLWRLPRILAIVFATLLGLVLCLPSRAVQRTLYPLACILLASIPLWVIATDWGRFFTCALVLAVVATARWQTQPSAALATQDDPSAVPSPVLRLAAWLHSLARIELLQFGALFLLFTAPDGLDAHIEGAGLPATQAFCLVAAIAWLSHRTQLQRRTGREATPHG